NQLRCRYINDTLKACWYDAEESFTRTTETQTINGWLCTKWVPDSEDLQGNVWVWIAKEVPKILNLGVNYQGFDGGLVKMEWTNGRYNILESFEQVSDYKFPMNRLKPKKATKEINTKAHIL